MGTQKAFFWNDVTNGFAHFNLCLPLWLPLAVVLLPTLASAFLLRRHARRPGHCPACGYDLTGNVTGRCPECGTALLSPES